MSEPVEVTLARLEERIKTMSDDVRTVSKEVADLKAQANRWKGAFWVMLAFGGVIGWFTHLLLGWSK